MNQSVNDNFLQAQYSLLQQLRVQHNYVDYADESPIETEQQVESEKKRKGPRGGVAVPFPAKLHAMLNGVENNGLSHIVSFQPHGRCFVVHKPKEFVRDVLPLHFNQSKLTSFQRQLNLYGFLRMTVGNDRNGYYHPMFLRGREFLANRIMRTRVKGNGGMKVQPNPETEPNFYSMPFVYRNQTSIPATSTSPATTALANMQFSGQSSSSPQAPVLFSLTPSPATAALEKMQQFFPSQPPAFQQPLPNKVISSAFSKCDSMADVMKIMDSDILLGDMETTTFTGPASSALAVKKLQPNLSVLSLAEFDFGSLPIVTETEPEKAESCALSAAVDSMPRLSSIPRFSSGLFGSMLSFPSMGTIHALSA